MLPRCHIYVKKKKINLRLLPTCLVDSLETPILAAALSQHIVIQQPTLYPPLNITQNTEICTRSLHWMPLLIAIWVLKVKRVSPQLPEQTQKASDYWGLRWLSRHLQVFARHTTYDEPCCLLSVWIFCFLNVSLCDYFILLLITEKSTQLRSHAFDTSYDLYIFPVHVKGEKDCAAFTVSHQGHLEPRTPLL